MLTVVGCLGAASSPPRSYYVLHGVTARGAERPPIRALLRVRDLDSATIYEKFQFVVRRSPYELRYNESHVWAVKPDRMVSDVIAQALAGTYFTTVSRELGEIRPDFILAGTLQAIEVYDSNDTWFAHLSLSLTLSRFSDGQTLVLFNFDERKEVPMRTFSQSARAISEMLSTAVDRLGTQLQTLDLPRGNHSPRTLAPVPKEPEEPTLPDVILVPETTEEP